MTRVNEPAHAPRRKHDAATRGQVISRVRDDRLGVAAAAREAGVHPSTVRRWLKSEPGVTAAEKGSKAQGFHLGTTTGRAHGRGAPPRRTPRADQARRAACTNRMTARRKSGWGESNGAAILLPPRGAGPK